MEGSAIYKIVENIGLVVSYIGMLFMVYLVCIGILCVVKEDMR
ncbi:hypothetical protein UT300012_24540 [Paraclostridium bifermentans]